MKHHTKKWRQKSLTEIQQLAKEYPTVALADIQGFPANLFARIRKTLSGKAVVRVTKTSLIQKMLADQFKKDQAFHGYAKNMCAIIFTKQNPFELYALVKRNKGNAPAKEGQLAPLDIIVPAGDTGLPPGPALTDLKNAGLKVKLQGPTIQVAEDKVVAKKGEVITKPVAAVLSKLNIKPIKVGLNITAVLEKGTVYLPVVLDVDEEQMFNNFQLAYANALALGVFIGYPTPATIKLLVGKAYRSSKAVALKAGLPTSDTIGQLMAQAKAVAETIKEKVKVPESA